jgi:hypothetical protein
MVNATESLYDRLLSSKRRRVTTATFAQASEGK